MDSKTSRHRSKTSRQSQEVFERCREVFEQNTPRQRRGDILLKLNEGRMIGIIRYHSIRVQFQPYTSSIETPIVRFHVYTSIVDYLMLESFISNTD